MASRNWMPRLLKGSLALLLVCAAELGAQQLDLLTDTAYVLSPKLTRGDPEFGGHGPIVDLAALIRVTDDSTGVFLCLYMRAVEKGGDSEAEGHSKPILIYPQEGDTTAHAKIDILSTKTAKLRHHLIEDDNDIIFGSSTIDGDGRTVYPLVKQWTIFGDTRGDDIGEYTKVIVRLKDPIKLYGRGGTVASDPPSVENVYSCEGLMTNRGLTP